MSMTESQKCVCPSLRAEFEKAFGLEFSTGSTPLKEYPLHKIAGTTQPSKRVPRRIDIENERLWNF